MFAKEITQTTIFRVLIAGFRRVILLDTDRRIAKIGDSVTDAPKEGLWDELQETGHSWRAPKPGLLGGSG